MLGPIITPRAFDERTLSPTARRLAAVYARYACFGHSEPTFRSKEFVKLIKEAGLEMASFNIRPPNRVDFVYTYACVHGPGGVPNNKLMSLEAFAFATKGIAHETGMDHEAVIAALEDVEPLLHSMAAAPPMPVSSRLLIDLQERASGADQYRIEKLQMSPIVRPGVLSSYSSRMSKRDAEQAAHSMEALRKLSASPRSNHVTKRDAVGALAAIEQLGSPAPSRPASLPGSRNSSRPSSGRPSRRVSREAMTPEWTAYSEPGDRNDRRHIVWSGKEGPALMYYGRDAPATPVQ